MPEENSKTPWMNLNLHALLLLLDKSNTFFMILQLNYFVNFRLDNVGNYTQLVSVPLLLLLVHVIIILTILSLPLSTILLLHTNTDVAVNVSPLLTDIGDAITITFN